jgi:hypothetical protein
MIIAFGLTLGMVAWVSFIYISFYYGDRPVTENWFAAMMGVGTFEYGKAMLGLMGSGIPAMPAAFGLAVAVAVGVAYLLRESAEADFTGAIEGVVGLPIDQFGAVEGA